MYIILTVLLLNMFSKMQSVPESSYIDLSDECSNNLKANYFLTYGMGSADGVALIFAKRQTNCTINIYTYDKANLIQIIVFEAELLDLYGACDKYLISDGIERVNLCEEKFPYVGLFNQSKTAVKLIGRYFDGIKLVATAARSTNTKCDSETEFMCNMQGTNLCINLELKCDGNINCISNGTDDEDCGSGYRKNLRILLAGIPLAVLVLLIFFKLCHWLTPKLPKYFFNTQPKTDNKLIVVSQSAMAKKLSTKTIVIKPALRQALKNSHKVDALAEEEEEVVPIVYDRAATREKRLTTNSPVFTNSQGGIKFVLPKNDYKKTGNAFKKSTRNKDIRPRPADNL